MIPETWTLEDQQKAFAEFAEWKSKGRRRVQWMCWPVMATNALAITVCAACEYQTRTPLWVYPALGAFLSGAWNTLNRLKAEERADRVCAREREMLIFLAREGR